MIFFPVLGVALGGLGVLAVAAVAGGLGLFAGSQIDDALDQPPTIINSPTYNGGGLVDTIKKVVIVGGAAVGGWYLFKHLRKK